MAGPAASARDTLGAGIAYLRRPAAWAFIANFGISKFVIYLTPLVIAVLTSAEVYGAIELGQSAGLLVATFLVGPAVQGLNQLFLVRGEARYQDVAWLLVAAAALVSLAAAAIVWASGADRTAQFVAAGIGGAGVHVIANQIVLMLGRRNLATWTAGANILIVGLLAALLAVPGGLSLEALTAAYLIFNVAIAILAAASFLHSRAPALKARIGQAVAIGLPMVIAGGFALWLSIGGRIVVGLFNAGDLPAYGVAFRVAGLLLGFHQLAMTALFVQLYRGRIRLADRLMTACMALVLIFGLVTSAAAYRIAFLFEGGALGEGGVGIFAGILPLTVLHTFFWIGQAMLQFRVNRYGLARAAIAPIGIATVGGALAMTAVAAVVDSGLELLCWMLALHAALLFFVTSHILRRRQLPHRRMEAMGLFGGILLAAAAVILPHY